MAKILVLSQRRARGELLALVLEFGGHHCEVAGNVTEALELLARGSFDAVVVNSWRQDFFSKLTDARKPPVIFANVPMQGQKGARKIAPNVSSLDQLLQTIDSIAERKGAKPLRNRTPAKVVAA
ncbi:MAG: hypothetical protein HY313_11755 [Acidobacteria bacterium]|nr:hypothetical protein [Acidobacteriota bacterium]